MVKTMDEIGKIVTSLSSHYSPLIEEVSLVVSQKVNSTAEVLSGCVAYYNYLMSLGDKRVETWGLMSSPFPTICITLAYLLMCLCGPKLMSSYKPFNLRPVVVLYNLFCAGLNLYIGLEIFLTSRQIQYSWTCQPVDYSWDPLSVRIARALWWYYISKLVELCDSLFIILHKKDQQQLSFLHIYHHATMFSLWWIGARYVAGGSSFLGAMFNCCVHVLMYSYYALAAIGGKIKKYLWWKKYLTAIQMLQFIAALVMGINAIKIGCDFPMWMQYSCCAYMLSFLVLFSNFYIKAYLRHGKGKIASNGREQEIHHMKNGRNKDVGNGNGNINHSVNGASKKLN